MLEALINYMHTYLLNTKLTQYQTCRLSLTLAMPSSDVQIEWACPTGGLYLEYSPMELSEAVVEGLKVAGSSSLSDHLFHSLLSRAVEVSPTSSDEGNPSRHG